MTSVLQWVNRGRWDLQRFGLSPGKVSARLRNQDSPKILAISVPKAGTHLLERALCLHPALYRPVLPTIHPKNVVRWGGLDRRLSRLRRGQVLIGHLPFSGAYPALLQRTETIAIFVVRDPRDVLVSAVYYIDSNPRHYLHGHLTSVPAFRDRLRVLIRGEPALGLESMGDRLRDYAGWLDGPAFPVRFEDLVGDHGRRKDALRAVYDYIGLPLDSATSAAINARLISSASPTFRAGATGGWRDRFDDELLAEFNLAIGQDVLAKYGY